MIDSYRTTTRTVFGHLARSRKKQTGTEGGDKEERASPEGQVSCPADVHAREVLHLEGEE